MLLGSAESEESSSGDRGEDLEVEAHPAPRTPVTPEDCHMGLALGLSLLPGLLPVLQGAPCPMSLRVPCMMC